MGVRKGQGRPQASAGGNWSAAMRVGRADKPRGGELLFARTVRHTAEILCVAAGQRLSLQHDSSKHKTPFLLEGEAELELWTQGSGLVRQRMAADQSCRVRPGQKHRLAALTGARILELSTSEFEDVVRWDGYGRAPFSATPITPRTAACPAINSPCDLYPGAGSAQEAPNEDLPCYPRLQS